MVDGACKISSINQSSTLDLALLLSCLQASASSCGSDVVVCATPLSSVHEHLFLAIVVQQCLRLLVTPLCKLLLSHHTDGPCCENSECWHGLNVRKPLLDVADQRIQEISLDGSDVASRTACHSVAFELPTSLLGRGEQTGDLSSAFCVSVSVQWPLLHPPTAPGHEQCLPVSPLLGQCPGFVSAGTVRAWSLWG